MVDSSTAAPSPEQVLRLPAAWTGDVTPEWIDANGHMNIRHYLDIGSHATISVCEGWGIDDDYRRDRRLGVFTAEHHLTYLREMHVGTPITAHVRLLDRSSTVGHMVVMIMDRRHDRLACVFETILVHVGMDTRRGHPFHDDVAAAYDRLLADQRADHDWPAPTCGIMGIRSRP